MKPWCVCVCARALHCSIGGMLNFISFLLFISQNQAASRPISLTGAAISAVQASSGMRKRGGARGTGRGRGRGATRGMGKGRQGDGRDDQIATPTTPVGVSIKSPPIK